MFLFEVAFAFQALQFYRIGRLLIHRKSQIRRPLIDSELFCLGRTFLNCLNTAGTCADHGNALVLEVNTCLWPFLREIPLIRHREVLSAGGHTEVW
jgi:hypothetical protein